MNKFLIAVIVMALLLTSCNLPTGKTSTPSADIIATRVAATLAASGSPATTEPVEQSATATVTETQTPSATATATQTPTATSSPDDPKLTLGSPDFWFNSASSGDPFGVIGNPYSDQSVTISNQVGGLTFVSKTINGGKRWRLTSPTPTNFYLEGTFNVVTCSGHDNYGLVMRVPTYNDSLGYYIGLSCDGNYIVDRLDNNGEGINLISWTQDTHINTGENQVNRLGVMLIDNTFKLYINGAFVTEFTDDAIPNKGHVGAYVSARGKENFTVVLQELLEWDK